MARQVLFIQGAGEGTYDDWDDKLVDSLRAELGDGFEVRYPRMPSEDDPSAATWVPAIRQAIADLDDGAVVVGHSVGGTLLVQTLVDQPPERRLGAIVLLATPFVGGGGWPADDDIDFTGDLGRRLPAGVPIHVVVGLDDDTVPPDHADLFAQAVAQAEIHRLPGCDHQLGNDLREAASLIQALGAA